MPGKYLYCITEAEALPQAEITGVGGKNLERICFNDLACIVSEATYEGPPPFPMDRESLMAHERVNEAVMQGGTVLPVRFGTVAPTTEALTEQALKPRYEEIRALLQDMRGKTEFGVRALWTDMPAIYREITEEERRIRTLRDVLRKRASYQGQIQLGELVQAALEGKRHQEAERLTSTLRGMACSWKDLELWGDQMMVLSAALLIRRDQERALDEEVNRLVDQHRTRLRFRYLGPTPPHNFVQLLIHFTP